MSHGAICWKWKTMKYSTLMFYDWFMETHRENCWEIPMHLFRHVGMFQKKPFQLSLWNVKRIPFTITCHFPSSSIHEAIFFEQSKQPIKSGDGCVSLWKGYGSILVWKRDQSRHRWMFLLLVSDYRSTGNFAIGIILLKKNVIKCARVRTQVPRVLLNRG